MKPKYIDWARIMQVSSLDLITISVAFSAEKLGLMTDEPKKYATKSQIDATFKVMVMAGEDDIDENVHDAGGIDLQVLQKLDIPYFLFTENDGHASHGFATEVYYELKEGLQEPYHGKFIEVGDDCFGDPLEEKTSINFFLATVYAIGTSDLYILLVPADVIDWDKLNQSLHTLCALPYSCWPRREL